MGGSLTENALCLLSNLIFLLLQLVAYWEKTFKIDLFRPQIGVVNVTDVSIPYEGLLRHPWPALCSATQPRLWEHLQESSLFRRGWGSCSRKLASVFHAWSPSQFQSVVTWLPSMDTFSCLWGQPFLNHWFGTFPPSKLSCIYPQSQTTNNKVSLQKGTHTRGHHCTMRDGAIVAQNPSQETRPAEGKEENHMRVRGLLLRVQASLNWGWDRLVRCTGRMRGNLRSQSRHLIQLHHRKAEVGTDTTRQIVDRKGWSQRIIRAILNWGRIS